MKNLYKSILESIHGGIKLALDDFDKLNVSNVRSMTAMFRNSTYIGNISNWNLNHCNVEEMFYQCQMKEKSKPKKLQNSHAMYVV